MNQVRCNYFRGAIFGHFRFGFFWISWVFLKGWERARLTIFHSKETWLLTRFHASHQIIQSLLMHSNVCSCSATKSWLVCDSCISVSLCSCDIIVARPAGALTPTSSFHLCSFSSFVVVICINSATYTVCGWGCSLTFRFIWILSIACAFPCHQGQPNYFCVSKHNPKQTKCSLENKNGRAQKRRMGC